MNAIASPQHSRLAASLGFLVELIKNPLAFQREGVSWYSMLLSMKTVSPARTYGVGQETLLSMLILSSASVVAGGGFFLRFTHNEAICCEVSMNRNKEFVKSFLTGNLVLPIIIGVGLSIT